MCVCPEEGHFLPYILHLIVCKGYRGDKSCCGTQILSPYKRMW